MWPEREFLHDPRDRDNPSWASIANSRYNRSTLQDNFDREIRDIHLILNHSYI